MLQMFLKLIITLKHRQKLEVRIGIKTLHNYKVHM